MAKEKEDLQASVYEIKKDNAQLGDDNKKSLEAKDKEMASL